MIRKISRIVHQRKPMNIYENPREELILRDFLALDRTVLANERTFLAWFRTAISLIAGGLAVIKFSHEPLFFIGGCFLVVVGGTIGFVGTARYIRIHRRLEKIKF